MTAHDAKPNADLYPLPPPEQTRGKAGWQFVYWVLGGALVGFLLAHFDMTLSLPFDRDHVSLPTILVSILLALWLQVLIHEAGHVVAGRLGGKRLLVAGFGPWRLLRQDGRWHIQWVGQIQGISGFAAMYTPHGHTERKSQAALFMLGGPLGNLVGAGLAVILAPMLPDGASWLRELAFWLFVMGLVTAALNLLPLNVGGWRSDGHQLLALLRNDPSVTAEMQRGQLLALTMAGIRPREWPQELVPAAPGETDSPAARFGSQFFRMELALDTGDTKLAGECAAALAGDFWHMPDGQRQGAAVLLALHAAWFLEDRDLLEAWLEHVCGGLVRQDCAKALLEAEAARLSRQPEVMQEALERAEATLSGVIDEVSRTQFRERINELAGRADKITRA